MYICYPKVMLHIAMSKALHCAIAVQMYCAHVSISRLQLQWH